MSEKREREKDREKDRERQRGRGRWSREGEESVREPLDAVSIH